MLSGGDVVCDFVNSDADSHIGSEYIMVGIDLHFDKLSIGGSSTLCKSEEDRKTSLLLCPPPPPAGVRSIAINVSSCLSVCSHIPKKLHVQTSPNSLSTLPVFVTWFSPNVNAISYVLGFCG